jgi:uncharacterized protein (TIGR02996 family)
VNTRIRSQVLKERENAVCGGCCERFADMKGCDCLATALPDPSPEEEAFQAALDLHPDDHTARLVFADFLEERGDPRAEGYRALAIGQHRTGKTKAFPCWWSHVNCKQAKEETGGIHAQLPHDWWAMLPLASDALWWFDARNRREAEDAATKAFSKLPAARRVELLKTEVLTCQSESDLPHPS